MFRCAVTEIYRHFDLVGILGVLVLSTNVGPAHAVNKWERGEGPYNCTSDADCQYDRCNDSWCPDSSSLRVAGYCNADDERYIAKCFSGHTANTYYSRTFPTCGRWYDDKNFGWVPYWCDCPSGESCDFPFPPGNDYGTVYYKCGCEKHPWTHLTDSRSSSRTTCVDCPADPVVSGVGPSMERGYTMAAGTNGKLYFYGGPDKFFEFDVASKAWSKLDSGTVNGTMPDVETGSRVSQGLSGPGHTLTLVGDDLYLCYWSSSTINWGCSSCLTTMVTHL